MLTRTWPHYCSRERAWLWVGGGEACNWCGEGEFVCLEEVAAELSRPRRAPRAPIQGRPKTRARSGSTPRTA